jgi:hypothetical protein
MYAPRGGTAPEGAAMRGAVTTLGGCLVAVCLLLAGCAESGSSNPYSLPSFDGSASGAPGAVATPTPSRTGSVPRMSVPPTAVKYQPADPYGEGAWVERGPSVADTASERAAVNAVAKYFSVFVQLSNTWVVDRPKLAAVAAQQALARAQKRATEQQEADRRTIGRFVVSVSSVKVSGASATVTGCDFDGTSEVDPDGGVMVGPPGGILITMQLSRTGGSWQVVQWPDHKAPVCDWKAH